MIRSKGDWALAFVACLFFLAPFVAYVLTR